MTNQKDDVSLSHQTGGQAGIFNLLNFKTMLFQGSTTTNSGTLTIKNMTNDAMTQAAVDEIGKNLLDEEVESVNVTCMVFADDGVAAEFDVYDEDGGSYLFSVTNDGVVYNK